MEALFEELFATRKEAVNAFLTDCFKGRDIPKTLLNAMDYSLKAGGKRLRPVLCLTGAALANLAWEKVLSFASAIELIHTYSLIHDDLPCMDDDDLRRGRPSNHKVYGEATALLAGDGLLTEAFLLMTSVPCSSSAVLNAIKTVAYASGCSGMVGGQEMDMEAEGAKDVSLAHMQNLHARKTGALLRASCVSGALLAEAPKEIVQALEQYGSELGIAFQIVDDILDEISDPEVLGKPVHSDREKNKVTYPALLGLEESQRRAHVHAANAKDALKGIEGIESAFLAALADYTVERVS